MFHNNYFGDIFMFFEVLFFFVVGQRNTKAHWGHPFPIFKHDCARFLKKDLCIKTVVVIKLIQRDTKYHYHQK